MQIAKTLRSAMTPPEARLWVRLRSLRAQGVSFRRQHPIGPYVLDFYCAKARLAVEVDGMVHSTGRQPERDERRDIWLESRGVRVIRIAAIDVLKDVEGVAEGLWRLVRDLPPPSASRPPPP